jgi:osmotically-inducible protein OsmY
MQKLEAEKTAKRVSGVVAVANDIEVPVFTI